jgi:hypothetical protein
VKKPQIKRTVIRPLTLNEAHLVQAGAQSLGGGKSTGNVVAPRVIPVD